LNVRLQNELNPGRADEPLVEKFGWQFRPRDKVIQTENDYDKDVFNGDIGQIVKIDSVEREVTIRFDQREVVYDFGELDEISLAYAITIHKSQGSEFPAVVIPLAMQQYMLLQRNLVYPGEKAGGANRAAKGAGDGCAEQPDGEPVFRVVGAAAGTGLMPARDRVSGSGILDAR
jgi:exodeoxyribonuclease V alpha subunit